RGTCSRPTRRTTNTFCAPPLTGRRRSPTETTALAQAAMAETVDDARLDTPPSRPPPLAASCAPSRRSPSPPACDGRPRLSPDRGWYRPTPLLFRGTDQCAG